MLISDRPPAHPGTWLREHYGWLLILSCLVLFTTKNFYNIPIGIMALIGAYRCIREPSQLFRLSPYFTLAFLAVWIPLVISLPDAVNFDRSIQTVVPFLRFFFAGLFIVAELRLPGRLQKLSWGVLAIVSIWCMDAMLQFALGYNLLGYPNDRLQLTGLFYPKMRLGLVTAVFLPVLVLNLHGAKSPWYYLLFLPVAGAILLSANRNAWAMTAVAVVTIGVVWVTRAPRINWLTTGLVSVAIVVFLAVAVSIDPAMQRRLHTSASILSSEGDELDVLLGRRLSLWSTAMDIATDKWINGIGPRGFRFAYSDYAPADNYWVQDGRTGQTHPHQFVLEIAVETGLIGVIGYLLLWLVLLRTLWQQWHEESLARLPWLLSGVIVLLPASAHMAFYGSFWASITWWVLAVGLSKTER